MRVGLDNPRVLSMKNGTKALSFTVILLGPDRLASVITNFRLMDGLIHGPASYSRKTKQYYQTAWLDEGLARAVYSTLVEKGWVAQYGLPALQEKEHAITPILFDAEVAGLVAPLLRTYLATTTTV